MTYSFKKSPSHPHPSGTKTRPQILQQTFSVVIRALSEAGRKQEEERKFPFSMKTLLVADEASSSLLEFNHRKSDSLNLTVESKIFKNALEFLSSASPEQKRETEELKTLLVLNLSVSLCVSLTPSDRKTEGKQTSSSSVSSLLSVCLSLFFLSLCPCLCCTLEASGGRC